MRYPACLLLLLFTLPLAAQQNLTDTILVGDVTRNYRVHLRLARNSRGEQRCRHALAARELYPNAEAARSLARRCD